MKYSLLSKTIFLFFVLSFFLFNACHKVSNELKPYSESITFNSALEYNGSTILNFEVKQSIQIGNDTLTIKITNPNSIIVDSIEFLVYFNLKNEFDNTLDFRRIIKLEKLAALSDTTLLLLSHPELPIKEEEMNFVLLNMSGISSNILNGVYDGIVGYLMPGDTLPSNHSFCKGVISADGNFKFWMKLLEVEKKCSGQFIDTIGVNALYFSSTETNNSNITLDTITPLKRFNIATNQLQFRIKLSGQPSNSESRIWFELNK